jgi:hypothetical protein
MTYEEYKDSDGYLHKAWMNDSGLPHREGAPSYIVYNPDGSVDREYFLFNGFLHRELGPAEICYEPDGSIDVEGFYINDRLHRETGPAQIYYNSDGSIRMGRFYLNGECLGTDKKGFWKLWDNLNEEQRNNQELLKYLTRYS